MARRLQAMTLRPPSPRCPACMGTSYYRSAYDFFFFFLLQGVGLLFFLLRGKGCSPSY